MSESSSPSAAHPHQPAAAGVPQSWMFTAAQDMRSELQRAASGDLPTDDGSIIELALALHDLDVRDYSLTFSLGADAAAAERLWTVLLRSCPGTYCAAPAVLAGVSAYLRGDDLRAGVALDTAAQANPTYRFAALLGRALDLGVPRSELAKMVNHVTTAGVATDDPTWP